MRHLCVLVVVVTTAQLVQLVQCVRYVGTGISNTEEENERIFLGGLFPIHKNDRNERCGDILDLGMQRQEAMVYAVQRINRDPTILPRLTLAFDIRDTCARSNKARDESLDYVRPGDDTLAPYRVRYHYENLEDSDLSADGESDLEDLVVHGVSGVVGAASSGVSIAVANLLRLFDIPQVSYASTAKILSDKTRFDYFFRTVPPDSLQAQAMADIVAHFNWTYVVAIHTDDAYGTEGIRAFFDELERLHVEDNTTNICIAKNIKVSSIASDEEFDQAVEEMDGKWVRNASVVVLFGQLATATGILDAVSRRVRANPVFAERSLTWIGSDAWGDQLPEEYHDLTQGMLSVIPQSARSREFDNYFQSLNPVDYRANPWFAEYWESFFNCSFRGSSTHSRCDPSTQRISYESGYRQNSKVTFTIDAVYSLAHAIDQLRRDYCTNGSICSDIVDERTGISAIRGDLLLQKLHNISFGGVSADTITFNAQGDQQGGYFIKNLQKSNDGHVFRIVGIWNGIQKQLHIQERVLWNQPANVPMSVCSLPCSGGEYPEHVPGQSLCCWTCQPCRGVREVSLGGECTECSQGFLPNGNKTACEELRLTYLTWSSPWSIMILLFTCTGLMVTSFVAAIFIVFNRTQIIKASSRELSAILLMGLILCYFIPLFFIVQPSTVICIFRRFGVGFCFSVCYSALLVKANRIHRIFNRDLSTTQMPPLVSPQSQIFFTALLVFVQVIITIVWLVVERPGTTLVYETFSTELKCSHSPHIGLSVCLGYNLLLILLCTYYAFRTRKIPQNFNEAKFINLTVYTLCIIWVAFIPTYFATAKLGTVYRTGSQMVTIILSATTTLCCLFLPKIYFLFSSMRKHHLGHQDSECSYHSHHFNSFERRRTLSLGEQICQ